MATIPLQHALLLAAMLFALGLGDKVVGVTDYCNYPAEAANRTKVGGITEFLKIAAAGSVAAGSGGAT